MGFVYLGPPTKDQIIGARIALIIFIVFVVCGIIYGRTEWALVKEIRSSSSEIPSIRYLKKYPEGKHVKEATDSIVANLDRAYSTYKITYNNDTISHLHHIVDFKEQIEHPLAIAAIDSLIRQRVSLEYKKAEVMNTKEAWELFYKVIPSEFWPGIEP